jgi:hypothetical protein
MSTEAHLPIGGSHSPHPVFCNREDGCISGQHRGKWTMLRVCCLHGKTYKIHSWTVGKLRVVCKTSTWIKSTMENSSPQFVQDETFRKTKTVCQGISCICRTHCSVSSIPKKQRSTSIWKYIEYPSACWFILSAVNNTHYHLSQWTHHHLGILLSLLFTKVRSTVNSRNCYKQQCCSF